MYFGGTVIASSWAVVALGSVWSKKLSSTGAFLGMLLGFIGYVVMKLYSIIMNVTLPMYLDPFFIGIVMSVIGAIIGTACSAKTAEEQIEHDKLRVSDGTVHGMKKFGVVYICFGVIFTLLMVVGYAVPYMRAVK